MEVLPTERMDEIVTAQQLRAILDWRMCSDPWPGGDMDSVDDWLDGVCREGGYQNWVEAYYMKPAEKDSRDCDALAAGKTAVDLAGLMTERMDENMMTDDEIIAVVQAKKAGKVIQCRLFDLKQPWDDISAPVWNFYRFIYRVKPELVTIDCELRLDAVGDMRLTYSSRSPNFRITFAENGKPVKGEPL